MTGELRLRLFSQDEMVLQAGEIGLLLRQRVMMLFYLTVVLALIWLNWDDRRPDMPLELHAAAQVGGVLVGGLVPLIALLGADRRARAGQKVVLSASRLFLFSAILGFLGYNLMAVPLGITPMPSAGHAALDIAFNFVLAQILGGLGVHFIVPAALAELRHTLSDTAPPPETGNGPTPAPALPGQTSETTPARPHIRVANSLFAPTDILRLQADGGHVVLTLPERKQVLPGPFSAVLAQMPPGLGQQVGRANWVATAAVIGLRLTGRDITLRLVDGSEVPIVPARQAKLRDWLESLRAGSERAAS